MANLPPITQQINRRCDQSADLAYHYDGDHLTVWGGWVVIDDDFLKHFKVAFNPPHFQSWGCSTSRWLRDEDLQQQ